MDSLAKKNMGDSEMCFCGKYRDQISETCSYPHPLHWIEWAKEREAKNNIKKELDLLKEKFANNGADDEKWIPGLTISESVLKYIETLEKKIDSLEKK